MNRSAGFIVVIFGVFLRQKKLKNSEKSLAKENSLTLGIFPAIVTLERDEWRAFQMKVESQSFCFEILARVRYAVLPRLRLVKFPRRIAYQRGRWMLLDSQRQVLKIAKTYFDLMQPYAFIAASRSLSASSAD